MPREKAVLPGLGKTPPPARHSTWDNADAEFATQRRRRDDPPMLTKMSLSRRLSRHVESEMYDDSGQSSGAAVAIYRLVDPRDLRATRYVGQTSEPRRRFLQHLNTARLWFPNERPWWVKSPRLRPLYTWIRELYADELRLPTMIICDWAETPSAARLQERMHIIQCLANGLPLLNIESERLAQQPPLL
jgi:hypothetical protein